MMRVYPVIMYMALLGGIVLAPAHALASTDPNCGSPTSQVGIYNLDHDSALNDAGEAHTLWAIPKEGYTQGSDPIECSPDVSQLVSLETAQMLRLVPENGCSDLQIISPAPQSVQGCRYEGPGPFTFELEEEGADPHVLVSLGLDSYRLGSRSMRIVERNLNVMTERIPERFKRYLSRSTRYLPMMKSILREEGIPEDLAYLPMIESGFSMKAYSRSRASGPWQFIKGTGKRYGLKINWWVDERRDPVKSSHAAARYLKDLYEEFGSWSLALAAYNAGEGRIRRALKYTKAKDFWSVMRTMRIKPETKNYVPKFIAARLIALDPEAYGFHDIPYKDELEFDEVTIDFPMSLDVIARTAGSTESQIRELNPELRRWSTPPVETYRLKIPRGTLSTFAANLPKIPEAKRVTVKVHRVRSGESVWKIARRYGVAKAAIISYNKLGRRALIRPGQRLIIPINYQKSGR